MNPLIDDWIKSLTELLRMMGPPMLVISVLGTVICGFVWARHGDEDPKALSRFVASLVVTFVLLPVCWVAVAFVWGGK